MSDRRKCDFAERKLWSKIFTNLETERLLLKNIGTEDADFFYRQFSTDEVNRYLFDAEPCAAEEEALDWIAFYLQKESRGLYRWILILKETNEKIGTCGFHCWNRAKQEAEIGYDLQPKYWRMGYMTEALREIIRFAFTEMDVKRIFAHISVDNTASIRTAEKLGFVRTGEQYPEEFHGKKYLHDIFVRSNIKNRKGVRLPL